MVVAMKPSSSAASSTDDARRAAPPAGGETWEDPLPDGSRAPRAVFGWVLVFLAWHVVWLLTGLDVPTASVHHGGERVVFYVLTGVVYLMVVAGVLLSIALRSRAWRRRVPRWAMVSATWFGTALLVLRGVSGVVDDVVRATGVLPDGLTGLTAAQTAGTADPSTWATVAGDATDLLFAVGGVLFTLTALAFRRNEGAPVQVAGTGRREPPGDTPSGRSREDARGCPVRIRWFRRAPRRRGPSP